MHLYIEVLCHLLRASTSCNRGSPNKLVRVTQGLRMLVRDDTDSESYRRRIPIYGPRTVRVRPNTLGTSVARTSRGLSQAPPRPESFRLELSEQVRSHHGPHSTRFIPISEWEEGRAYENSLTCIHFRIEWRVIITNLEGTRKLWVWLLEHSPSLTVFFGSYVICFLLFIDLSALTS
jgi:hypothetical protein